MASESTVRITFSCEPKLRDLLTTQSNKEGIPRSQLIVELLEMGLKTDASSDQRNPAVNRLLFDVQERISHLEGWRKEIQDWRTDSTVNTDNLEHTMASLLNAQLEHDDQTPKKSKKAIPQPKR